MEEREVHVPISKDIDIEGWSAVAGWHKLKTTFLYEDAKRKLPEFDERDTCQELHQLGYDPFIDVGKGGNILHAYVNWAMGGLGVVSIWTNRNHSIEVCIPSFGEMMEFLRLYAPIVG